MFDQPPVRGGSDDEAPLDCLIVGAGPAGLTAALYLLRFRRGVALHDGGGSRALYIDRSHNCPGYPEGIAGGELLARLRRQVHDHGGTVRANAVLSLSRTGRADAGVEAPFVAEVEGGVTCRARTVLLATGTVDVVPALPGLEKLRDQGLVRQCPVCDGHDYARRRIAVVGDGSHAAREALFIAHFSDSVAWAGIAQAATCTEVDDTCCAADLDNRVKRLHAPVTETRLHGEGVELVLADGSAHAFDVIYAAAGSRPALDLAVALGARCDERGGIVVDDHCRSSVPGLYAAGEVVSALDQIAVAFGHAAIAATAIHNGCNGLSRARPR